MPEYGGFTYPDTLAEYALIDVPNTACEKLSVEKGVSPTGRERNGAGRATPDVSVALAYTAVSSNTRMFREPYW